MASLSNSLPRIRSGNLFSSSKLTISVGTVSLWRPGLPASKSSSLPETSVVSEATNDGGLRRGFRNLTLLRHMSLQSVTKILGAWLASPTLSDDSHEGVGYGSLLDTASSLEIPAAAMRAELESDFRRIVSLQIRMAFSVARRRSFMSSMMCWLAHGVSKSSSRNVDTAMKTSNRRRTSERRPARKSKAPTAKTERWQKIEFFEWLKGRMDGDWSSNCPSLNQTQPLKRHNHSNNLISSKNYMVSLSLSLSLPSNLILRKLSDEINARQFGEWT